MSVVQADASTYAEEMNPQHQPGPDRVYNIRSNDLEHVLAEIGKRIVLARKAANMSQETLATKSDIDRSHMGFIEQGRRRPTLATLLKVSRALNMTLEDLFKGL